MDIPIEIADLVGETIERKVQLNQVLHNEWIVARMLVILDS
jgi:hypothetical protein